MQVYKGSEPIYSLKASYDYHSAEVKRSVYLSDNCFLLKKNARVVRHFLYSITFINSKSNIQGYKKI